MHVTCTHMHVTCTHLISLKNLMKLSDSNVSTTATAKATRGACLTCGEYSWTTLEGNSSMTTPTHPPTASILT